MSLKPLTFPYINYKGEFSIRSVEPMSLKFQEKNLYHGEECFILTGYDFEKKDKRGFNFEDIVKGTIHHTLKSLGECSTPHKIEGIYLKMFKEKNDAS